MIFEIFRKQRLNVAYAKYSIFATFGTEVGIQVNFSYFLKLWLPGAVISEVAGNVTEFSCSFFEVSKRTVCICYFQNL